MRVNLRINSKNNFRLLKFTLIWDKGLHIIILIIIIIIIIYIILSLIRCLQFWRIDPLIYLFIYLFIFNLWIRLQLICPCARFCFLLAVSLWLFLLSLEPFLANLLVLWAPQNTGESVVLRFCAGHSILFSWWCSPDDTK